MTININRTFIQGMTAATVFAAASVLFHWPVPIVLFAELAPLVWYFQRLYKAGASGLSHTAIDSVYYFGFIVTIMALAGSVFRVWLFGIEKDLTGLIAQFGVGLLATGLALVFRLVLTARVESMNAKDLEQAIAEYVSRIDGVVSKIEVSAASFEGLSASLQERTRAVVQATFEECSASMRAATIMFNESISQITTQASQSVTKFSEVVHSVAVSEHVTLFDSNIVQLSAGLKNFAEEVTTFGKTTTEEALNATRNAISASTRLHSETLATITAETRTELSKSIKSISDLDLSVDTSMVRTDLANLSRTVTNFTKRFAELEDKISEVQTRNNVEALLPVVNSFAEEMQRVGNLIANRSHTQQTETLGLITSEIAKGVASVKEMNASENNRRDDEFSTQIDKLITQLERVFTLSTKVQPSLTASESIPSSPTLSQEPNSIKPAPVV